MGSGCGAVSSNTRDPRFKSSHGQFYRYTISCIKNCIERTKIKKKEAENGHSEESSQQ